MFKVMDCNCYIILTEGYEVGPVSHQLCSWSYGASIYGLIYG